MSLNYTITIPVNYVLQASSLVPAHQQPCMAPQRIRDSIGPSQQVSLSQTDCLSQAWNVIVNFFKSMWGCLCKKKAETLNPEESCKKKVETLSPEGSCKRKVETLSPEEIERRGVVRERELAVWQTQMAANLTSGRWPKFVDLSGRITEPGYCSALQMERVPQIGQYAEDYPILNQLLAVKLPARQLHRFPEAIRNELSSYDANHLDIYFIIWRDIPIGMENVNQLGKRNLIYHPIAYPNAAVGETHNHNLSMGIFDIEGIERAPGPQHQALPFNQFGQQNVHIHPGNTPDTMCISPDQARFYLPTNRAWSAFNSACKFPDGRAAAVFGVILDSADRTLASHIVTNPLQRNSISLQEYKTEIQNSLLDSSLKEKMMNILDFY